MSYSITKNFIPGLPTFPYRHGVGAYEGVVSHCTDSSNRSGGDTPSKERAYEARTFNQAFVHFFVGVENGDAVILQVASTDYGAYGAGPVANKRFVHVELCMYDDEALFSKAYDAYVYVLAKLLHDRKLDVTKAAADGSGTLWSHKDVNKFLGGTTHEDPIAYLAEHNISWNQHVKNVASQYSSLTSNKLKIVSAASAAILMDGPDRQHANNIGTVPLGTIVENLGKVQGKNNKDGYYKISYKGKTGYITARFGKPL
ncbi:N-acetylmuramoyl-L-alanine amidase [Fictibacillus macauensis ZFHKF-1]|uniref:N-acetylmuramoyl-L-alanine amidase n=2 Tax=Fictibacillus TaxID=1329200 RepID=I8AEK1_9BACL|nr:N-acetylmuramoyl-L-alanine amidase [Fictibacillus macauensis ZFHKF-1]